jgi:hypothetical protein
MDGITDNSCVAYPFPVLFVKVVIEKVKPEIPVIKRPRASRQFQCS